MPQQGVTRTPRGDASVMLVNDKNQVETREVVATQAVGDKWLITSGLKPGDKVIVQRLTESPSRRHRQSGSGACGTGRIIRILSHALSFFIHRPVFAWVLAIIMMIAGGLAILQLPIAQYPTIAPPAVAISATYPGADAQTVQDTVTQVIEQNMNGIDNLMYMSSTSDSAGSVTITLTFKSGTDPDIAQVQVQNKLRSWLRRCCLRKYSSKGLASKNPAAASCWLPALSLITRPPPRTIFLTMSPPT